MLVRMDGGSRGWGKGEEKPARRGYWKTKYPLILPLISCVPLHFRKWAGNQSKWVKLKTESTLCWLKKKTHVELISETVRWSFFSRQYLLHGHKYELIFAALYIFLSIAAVIYLTVLLPFEGNFEAKKKMHSKVYLPWFVWYKPAHSGETVWLAFFLFSFYSSTKKWRQLIRGKEIFSGSQVDIRVQTSKLLKAWELLCRVWV